VLQKIRAESRGMGIVTIFLSVMLGFQVVWIGNMLPAAEHSMMAVVIVLAAATDACLLVIGIAVFGGPKCVSTGSLDENRARGLRALVSALGIMGLLSGLVSGVVLVVITTQFGVLTVLYLSFSLIALILVATNFYVIRRLRPTKPGPAPGPGTRW
jgi:hypothetical protein